MEEGLFPHQMSINEPGRLEEERRLCYVGITRAKQLLYFTHAQSRRLHGKETYPHPSRFIQEIPIELIKEVRMRATVNYAQGGAGYAPGGTGAPKRAAPMDDEPMPGLRLGQHVTHAKFGEGVVLNYEGKGAQARVQVNFRHAGSKWLMVSYANLQPA